MRSFDESKKDWWSKLEFSGAGALHLLVYGNPADGKGHPSWFDLLVACRFDSQCFLEVSDLGAHV